MPPAGADRVAFRAIYVRMVVEKRSDESWTLDEAKQRVEMTDRREAVMMYATTPVGARAPVVEIAPGKSFRLDLLFPLPAGLSNASELPAST